MVSACSVVKNTHKVEGAVFILNEGRYNYFTLKQEAPVSIGMYSPTSRIYKTMAVIEGSRFASDLVLHEHELYVAADNKVIKYNLPSFSVALQADVPGCRKLSFWKDKLIISLGDKGKIADNLLILDKDNFKKVYAIANMPRPVYAADKTVIAGNRLYLAVNNAYDSNFRKGYVDIIDMERLSFLSRIVLPDGNNNIENLMWDTERMKLVTFNNNDYSHSSVSIINMDDLYTATKVITPDKSCTTSSMLKENDTTFVYFHETGSNYLGRFDINNWKLTKQIPINSHVYCIAENPTNKEKYVSATDYVSYGSVYIYSEKWKIRDSFQTGISPGTIVFDIK